MRYFFSGIVILITMYFLMFLIKEVWNKLKIKIRNKLIEGIKSLGKKGNMTIKLIKFIIEKFNKIEFNKLLFKKIHIAITKLFRKLDIAILFFIIVICIIVLSGTLVGILSDSIFKSALVYILIVSTFIFSCYIVVLDKNNMFISKFEKLFNIVLILLLGFVGTTLGYLFLLINKFGLISIVISFIIFLIVCIVCIFSIQTIFSNKVVFLIFSVLIYSMLIATGSLISGFYYYSIGKVDGTILNSIKGASSYELFILLTKVGIKFFYNFPTGEEFSHASILQFLVGKLLDIFMLGYVLNKFTEGKKLNQDEISHLKM